MSDKNYRVVMSILLAVIVGGMLAVVHQLSDIGRYEWRKSPIPAPLAFDTRTGRNIRTFPLD